MQEILIIDCGTVLDDIPTIHTDTVIVEEPTQNVEDVENTPQDEENPYVIGLAPPVDSTHTQRFLSFGVGKRVFRPQVRGESAVDVKGRRVKGRGLIVFFD